MGGTLHDRLALDAATIDGYARDGHAIVRGLLPVAEAESYRAPIEYLSIKTARNRSEMKEPGNTDGVFLQAFNLWKRSPEIAAFVLARRFASAAAQLMDVANVRLYHDQSLCKGAGAGRTPWHQDQFYWPLDTDRTITMWMPLLPVPEEIGSMTFASGSHTFGALGGTGINKESSAAFDETIDAKGLARTSYGAMAPGDATFHSGWTLHSAARNTTDELRTVMTVIYYADGVRVADDLNRAQELDRQVWLGGRECGALADHNDNRLLL